MAFRLLGYDHVHINPARTKLAVVLLAIAVCAARAQQPVTPQQHLESATSILLDTAAPPDSDAGRKLSTLQLDYADLSTAALASSTGNWRQKYAAVENDLKALMGTPGVDAQLQKQLDSFRAELQLFYATSLGQPPVGDPVARTDGTGIATAATVPQNRSGAVIAPATPGSAVAASQLPATGSTQPPPASPQNPAPASPAPQPTATSQPQTPTTPPPPAPAQPPTTPAPAGSTPGNPTPGMEPAVRECAPPVSDEEVKTMLSLLDRVDQVVTKARNDTDVMKAVGTGGKSPSEVKVSIEASSVDEIRAEITQLRQMLQQLKPRP